MRIWLVLLENEAETQRPWYGASEVLDSMSLSVVKQKKGGIRGRALYSCCEGCDTNACCWLGPSGHLQAAAWLLSSSFMYNKFWWIDLNENQASCRRRASVRM
jgi:hypothetical protein